MLQGAWRVAAALSGNPETAAHVVRSALGMCKKAAHAREARRAFWENLVRLALGSDPGSPVPSEKAALGFAALREWGGLGEEEAAQAVSLRVPPRELPQLPPPDALAITPSLAAELEQLEHAMGELIASQKTPTRNPAIWAAAAGGMILAALALWHLTGRVGVFPEEIVAIATSAGKAALDDFTPVEARAGDMPDYMALQGLEAVKVPVELAQAQAVGVRTFRHEGEIVTQIAAFDGGQRFFLLSFPARPFGISLPPPGSWRFKQAGKFALAAAVDPPACIVVSMPGKVADLVRKLGTQPHPQQPATEK